MGILHFSQSLLIFYVIRWELCNFSLFCRFSMLFNGKLVFSQFPMLFNGNLRLEKLQGGCTYGRTDRPSYRDARTHLKNAKFLLNNIENCYQGFKYALSGRLEIHPCVIHLTFFTMKLIKRCLKQQKIK